MNGFGSLKYKFPCSQMWSSCLLLVEKAEQLPLRINGSQIQIDEEPGIKYLGFVGQITPMANVTYLLRLYGKDIVNPLPCYNTFIPYNIASWSNSMWGKR